MECSPRLSTAQERVALPGATLDRERLLELPGIEPAGLREEGDRVLPHERLDGRLGNATVAKMHDRPRDLEWIAPSPGDRAVDAHSLDAGARAHRAHALLSHLRGGGDTGDDLVACCDAQGEPRD